MTLRIGCIGMEMAHPNKPASGGQEQVPALPF